jgi:hypothetical protein
MVVGAVLARWGVIAFDDGEGVGGRAGRVCPVGVESPMTPDDVDRGVDVEHAPQPDKAGATPGVAERVPRSEARREASSSRFTQATSANGTAPFTTTVRPAERASRSSPRHAASVGTDARSSSPSAITTAAPGSPRHPHLQQARPRGGFEGTDGGSAVIAVGLRPPCQRGVVAAAVAGAGIVVAQCFGGGPLPAGDSFWFCWHWAGLVQVGNFEGDRSEYVDDQQVGRPGGGGGVESSGGEELEEPLVQRESVRAGEGAADH